jgi:hypothetical protein
VGGIFLFGIVSISARGPSKLPLSSHINDDWYGKDKVIMPLISHLAMKVQRGVEV